MVLFILLMQNALYMFTVQVVLAVLAVLIQSEQPEQLEQLEQSGERAVFTLRAGTGLVRRKPLGGAAVQVRFPCPGWLPVVCALSSFFFGLLYIWVPQVNKSY